MEDQMDEEEQQNGQEMQHEEQLKREWQQIFSDEAADRTIHVTASRHKYAASCVNYIHTVNGYFEQFGEVESVRSKCTLDESSTHCLFVQFKDAEVAAKLVAKRRIGVNSVDYEIKAVDQSSPEICDNCAEKFDDAKKAEDSNYMEPLQPPDESSPNNILNALDDDCLRETFGKLRDYLDFYSVANVCVRFSKIAKEVFASKFKDEVIRFDQIITSNSIDSDLLLTEAENVLSIFGQYITSIDCVIIYVQNGYNSGMIPKALRMIAKYCTNLRHLRTLFPRIDHDTLVQIQPLLSKLRRLYIQYNYLPDEVDNQIQYIPFDEFVSACSRLRELKIYGTMPSEMALPEITFPKLITFKCDTFDNPSWLKFLSCNPQLQKIRSVYSADVCRLIRQNMLNIQKLHLTHAINLMAVPEPEFERLKDVDNLIVKLKSIVIVDSINDATPMENVTCISFDAHDPFDENYLVTLARKFKNLEKLSVNLKCLSLSISTAAIKQMLKYTDKLTLLKISWPMNVISHFDAKDYNELLEAVQKRENHTKMRIVIVNFSILPEDGHHIIYNKKQLVFNTQPEWLSVRKVFVHITPSKE